ncbi:MAG: succinate dehydrogenase assembly factor 2 [Pseudomonadota bacterium]|nr:succinate dehydrogenase assembly factor 2 [Pseudomonadota bacterium]
MFRATHRGTYENDILIGRFVRARLDAFTEAELDEVERLMDHPEAVLGDWLMGRRPIPDDEEFLLLRLMRQAAIDGEGRIP